MNLLSSFLTWAGIVSFGIAVPAFSTGGLSLLFAATIFSSVACFTLSAITYDYRRPSLPRDNFLERPARAAPEPAAVYRSEPAAIDRPEAVAAVNPAPVIAAKPALDYHTQNKLNNELLNACDELDLPAIRKSIEAGAQIETQRNGKTPLIIICEKANRRFLSSIRNIIIYLLGQGADPFQLFQGKTAFQFIVQKGLHELFSLFKEAKVKEKNGVSIENFLSQLVSQNYQYSCTPLTSLIVDTTLSLETKKTCLETLLAMGADTEAKGCIHFQLTQNMLGPYPLYPNSQSAESEASAPLIGLLRALKVAIEKNENAETVLKPLYDMCDLLLKKGANPLAKTTRRANHEETTFTLILDKDLPDHPLMNELLARFNEAMDLRNQNTFKVSDEAAKSQDEAILEKLIQDGLIAQRLSQNNVVILLTEAFLSQKNIKGLECLLNAVTPKTPGYALLCREMANQYRDSAVMAFDEATGVVINADNAELQKDRKRNITLLEDKPEAKAEVEEYRRLFLLYCLKGAASREKDPKVQDIKNHLAWEFKKHMFAWEDIPAIDGDKKEEDIFDFATQRLVSETRLALLFKQKAKPTLEPKQTVEQPVAKNDAALPVSPEPTLRAN